jgi:ribosomal protein L12E/L44/L45/RPP1/RPP2
VAFAQLADARMQFRTFLEPAGATLTAADIEEVIETIEVPAATVPAPGAAAPGAAEAPAAQPLIEERRSYQLSEEKKIELFLSYINRMVDLLFQ